jgi:hypothetical protein
MNRDKTEIGKVYKITFKSQALNTNPEYSDTIIIGKIMGKESHYVRIIVINYTGFIRTRLSYIYLTGDSWEFEEIKET